MCYGGVTEKRRCQVVRPLHGPGAQPNERVNLATSISQFLLIITRETLIPFSSFGKMSGQVLVII